MLIPTVLLLLAVRAPDVGTLEDIYGPSGESFQAALGFRVFEGNTTQGASQTGFGVSIDDMVVRWREYRLSPDQISCATSGACAAVELDTTNVFDGNGVLTITVTDPSPYRCTGGNPTGIPPCTPEGKNDCNHNGLFTDSIDDADCDDDGTPDVQARAFSNGEPAGEWVVLDRIGSTSSYRGSLPLSIGGDVSGVLFVTDSGDADLTVRYGDDWDGTPRGSKCGNAPASAAQGFVERSANLVIEETGSVALVAFRIDDAIPQAGGGASDGDGYPDTNETADLYVTLQNKTGSDLTNLVAQASVNDPKIECLLRSVSTLGFLAAGAVQELPVPFRFKVRSNADRAAAGKAPSDDFLALFTLRASADQFDLNAAPIQIAVDLDLDSQAPVVATTTFTEGFEIGFGNFIFMNLDYNIGSDSASNGMRCQYSDPDRYYSHSYGSEECHLGFPGGQSPINEWHVHGTVSPDGGRAYLGTQSIHYGKHTPANPNLDTYGTSQLDAIRTKNDLHLAARVCAATQGGQAKSCNTAADCTSPASACIMASPLLSFKHQVSLVDNRHVNVPFGQTADRAVVHALLAGGTIWQKLTPYQNLYDAQGTDFFSNCMFDPTDDGHNEDSYFDPTDPERRLGPSSTCMPEFVFTYLGDTDEPFHASKIGRASDGPGLQGSLGRGTWVESRIDLSRYRGRSIKLRFLITSISVGDDVTTWQGFASWNPTADDDGWYIDDVQITQTLGASSPTVTNDTQNHGNATCGAACTSLVAALTADPAVPASPGRRVILSASVEADRCVNGVLLHQFWLDVNGNGAIDPATDAILREFSTNFMFEVSPTATTRYLVRSKCSAATAPPCNAQDAGATVTVASVSRSAFFPWARLTFSDRTTLAWAAADASGVEVIRGDLFALLASGGDFQPTVQACVADDTPAATATDGVVPAVGNPFYYLARRSVPATTWSTFSGREVSGRDSGLDGPPRALNACAAPP